MGKVSLKGLRKCMAAGLAAMISYAVASSYMWVFAGAAVLCGAMIGMLVYGIVNIRKKPFLKRRAFYNWTTVLLLGTTVVNILYWNLFMGWLV